MTVFCATTNPGKLREFRLILGHSAGAALELEPLPGLSAIEPCVETGRSFDENAVQKATHYGRHTAGSLFADDSGLEVNALGGAPGIHSGRFAGAHADDEANNRLLLEKLAGGDDRRARFVCVIALVRAGRLEQTFHGAVEGEILQQPRGEHGFGYDPLFYYPPFGCSFGETPPERKLLVSHRGQALTALVQYLLKK